MAAAVPFIGPALGVVGSLIGSSGAKKAAKQQVAGQQAAIDTQEKYLSPFSEAGTAGLGAVQDFVDTGANFADTQAFKDIINTQKARGASLSGGTLTGLTDYYANNFRPQRLNELAFLPQLGARAAGDLAAGIGGLQQNIGDARAQGTIGSSNALVGGLGAIGGINFSNLLSPTNLAGQPQSNLGGLTPQQYYTTPTQPFGTFNTGIGPFGGG